MDRILRIDKFVGGHMPWFILLSVLLGISFPTVFSPLKNSFIILMALCTFLNSLGGGFRDLKRVLQHPLPLLLGFLMLHLVLPAMVLGVGTLLYPDEPAIVSGLVLQFTLPVGVSTLMWVAMSGGNVSLCLSMVLMDTLLSPFSIPLTLRLLLGSAVELNSASMMRDLLLMVCIPAIISMFLYEKTDGRIAQTVKPKVAPLTKLLTFLMMAITASNSSDFFLNIDLWFLVLVVTVVLLNGVSFFLGYLVSKPLKMPFPSTFTMSLLIGFRNMSAGIVLAQQYFPPQAVLPVTIMPLFQQLMVSIIVKLLWKTPSGQAYARSLAAK